MPQYLDNLYIENQISRYRQRFVPLFLTTSITPRQLTLADPTLIIVDGSTAGYNIVLPDATGLENGYEIIIHNNSSVTVDVDTFGGTHYLQMSVGSRMSLFLKSNATQPGVWVRAIQSSSPFTGTSPVLGSYNGNAGVGRYLEVYPRQGTDTAPFYVPTNAYIVAFEFSTVSTSTATLGVFKSTDLVNPIYTISLSNATTVFGTNLTISLSTADQLSFRITAATGTVGKPRCAMYFTGV